jgi:syntaxin 1B/2/3
MAAPRQQYGNNNNYNQIGSYGSNPYDQRDGADAGRYNNYSQGRYDDRTYCLRLLTLQPH